MTPLKNIKPMLATLVDSPPIDQGWIYEVKWDGYRALAFCNKAEVNLISRNNKSFNDKYYPIVQALSSLNYSAVLDGEIVVVKESGIASFEGLQDWRSEADGELIYYVFDILWLNGKDLTHLPLMERKKLLQKLLSKNKGIIRESSIFDTKPEKLLSLAKEMGLEGLIAKRADSPYLSGIRSEQWVKIKAQKRHEVVIGGYTKNENSPKPFSALLVGVFENGSLQYTGKIGTGFSQKMQKEMLEKFRSLEIKKCPFSYVPDINKPSRFRPNPPFATAVWLSPKLTCEVSYIEITRDGVMRHPSFKGMREDKDAKDVHSEIAISPSAKPTALKISKVKSKERKSLLNPKEETQVKIIHEREIKFNNLSKIFWPKLGLTKRDLLNYYYQAAPYLLPYLKGRPQSLNRFPNGIEGLSFYQKDVTKAAPSWMKQFPYRTSLGEDKNYLVVEDEADILWMANLGAIEMNPWNSRVEKPDYPTWCLIDIDPTEKNTFEQVIQVALETKQVLDALKIKSYCKTSGADGIHIYIPMGENYNYEECQSFGRLVATTVHKLIPKFTSIERYTNKREGKIYVDFLQNRPKATLAAPYSVRPKPDATVSMPLHWDEVKKGLKPQNFTLVNAIERIKREGDLFKPVLGKGIDLKKILKNLKEGSKFPASLIL